MNSCFDGRLGLIQRVLPVYRAPFFSALASVCSGGLHLVAGKPRTSESIQTTDQVSGVHFTKIKNQHLLGGPLYFCVQTGLQEWLASTQPDALIVEANPRYLSSPTAVRWMHQHHKPVIGWGLGVSEKLSLFTEMRSRFINSFDAIIAYSQKGAREYAALGIDKRAVFVAHNAAAAKPTHPLPTRSAEFTGKPVVLFVGRLQERKRLDNLLKACAQLPEDLQPILQIVGEGPVRQDLEVLAQKIYPSTQFLGAKFGDDLDAIFANTDLFVLPGTGGLAVQQAMSFGLPVIAAQGDGTQDDLVRPGSGWRIPQNDLDSLTKALQDALSNPDNLRIKGSEAYRIVSDEINLENMVQVFLNALKYAESKIKQEKGGGAR